MKKPKSKEKKIKKPKRKMPVIRPVFNTELVQNILAKSTNSFAMQGQLLRDMLDRQSPFFKSMIERMNEAAKTYQSAMASLADSGVLDHMKEAIKTRMEIEESVRSFVKEQENYSREKKELLLPKSLPEPKNEFEDQYIEKIVDKLMDRIEQRGLKVEISKQGISSIKNVSSQIATRKENGLKSIHLVTLSLEPKDVIFLVLDENFQNPVRFSVFSDKGEITYIKKLYDIAYLVNVPGKRVDYDKNLADCINNGLFRKREVQKYMRTNKLKKPTLVKKSEDGRILVLNNEILVKTLRVMSVPSQFQYLYIDKTR